MLISISSFSLLALLSLAPSGATTIDFVCSDGTVQDPIKGFCLRPVNAQWDAKNPIVQPDTAYLGPFSLTLLLPLHRLPPKLMPRSS